MNIDILIKKNFVIIFYYKLFFKFSLRYLLQQKKIMLFFTLNAHLTHSYKSLSIFFFILNITFFFLDGKVDGSSYNTTVV